jgi:hypothetical protein
MGLLDEFEKIAGHVSAQEHDQAQKLINRLPQGAIRNTVQGFSNAMARGPGSLIPKLPGGVPGNPSINAALEAGPARPHMSCGIPRGILANLGKSNRRPFQFMMLVTIPAGTPIVQGPANGSTTTWDFVQPVGSVNAKSGCTAIETSSYFPNWFISTSATMTISAGGGATSGAGNPQLAEAEARIQQLEVVEFHAGQERARYPVGDFRPKLERYVSDQTGSAVNKDHLTTHGVMFQQYFKPLMNFDFYINNQGPEWAPSNDLLFLFTLKGSIGEECSGDADLP